MKQLFKRILVVPTFVTIIFTNISANKSNWAGMSLKPNEINSSVHFQVMRGSTCIGEFEKVKPVLDRFISQKLDASYLTNILGKPNQIIAISETMKYNYYLTAKSDEYIVSLTIKNNNLLSYKMENYL